MNSSLLHNLCNCPSSHSPSTFSNGKPQPLVHGHRRDQVHDQAHVVARHHHLSSFRQFRHSRHVRRPEVKLRPVSFEERRVPPAFILAQYVNLAPELLVRRNRSRLGDHLPALHIILFNSSQHPPHVLS